MVGRKDMDFPNPSPLKKAVDDLKDIVSRSQGEEHEISVLVRQIEAIVAEIEIKTNKNVAIATSSVSAPLVSTQATTTVIPVPPIQIPSTPVV